MIVCHSYIAKIETILTGTWMRAKVPPLFLNVDQDRKKWHLKTTESMRAYVGNIIEHAK